MKIYQFFGAWLLVLSTAMPVFAQQYDYQLAVKQPGNIHKIYLGYWQGEQAFLLDSVSVDSIKNIARFTGSKDLPVGQYFFANDVKPVTLDFIINGEKKLRFSTIDDVAWADSFSVVNSKENTPYFVWKSFKTERETGIANARTMLDMLRRSTKDRTVLEEQGRKIRRLREEIDSFSRIQRKQYPDLLFAKIIVAETPPAIPAAISPLDNKGQVNPAYMQFFRDHFWDNYDFTDERLLNTPVLARKTDDWMQLQSNNIDSVKAQLDIAVAKAAVNKKSKQMLLRFLMERLDKPSYGGNETLVVHLFDKHYPTATAAGIDTATWMRIEYKANAYRPTLPGMMAPPFTMQDTAGNMLSLYDFKAKYTLLYFFNPLCSHCIEMTPEVYQLTLPYAAKGIRVLAVSTETQPDTWKAYIRKNVPLWTCVADFAQQSPLEKTYATSTLPNLLLLDENKKIVIRRLPVKELPNVLKMIGN